MEGIIQGFDDFLNLVIGGGVEVVKREDQVNLGQILYIYLTVIPFHPEREERDWNGGDSRQKCGVSCYAGASPVKTTVPCRVGHLEYEARLKLPDSHPTLYFT